MLSMDKFYHRMSYPCNWKASNCPHGDCGQLRLATDAVALSHTRRITGMKSGGIREWANVDNRQIPLTRFEIC
jgi:hypothetical protein